MMHAEGGRTNVSLPWQRTRNDWSNGWGPGLGFSKSSDSFSRLCFLSRHLFRSVFSEHPLFSPVTFTSCFIGDTTTTPLRVDVEANSLGKGSNAGGT